MSADAHESNAGLAPPRWVTGTYQHFTTEWSEGKTDGGSPVLRNRLATIAEVE